MKPSRTHNYISRYMGIGIPGITQFYWVVKLQDNSIIPIICLLPWYSTYLHIETIWPTIQFGSFPGLVLLGWTQYIQAISYSTPVFRTLSSLKRGFHPFQIHEYRMSDMCLFWGPPDPCYLLLSNPGQYLNTSHSGYLGSRHRYGSSVDNETLLAHPYHQCIWMLW